MRLGELPFYPHNKNNLQVGRVPYKVLQREWSNIKDTISYINKHTKKKVETSISISGDINNLEHISARGKSFKKNKQINILNLI